MVKIFAHRHYFEHKWDTVTLAWWLKYPNPFSLHVLAGDVIERRIDHLGRLCTTRLLLKTGSIPTWAQSWMKSSEAYVLEESIVDPRAGTMQTRTRNLTYQRFMTVEETQSYTSCPENHDWTLVDTQATFRCHFGWSGLAARLEGLSASRFREHFQKSRKALGYVLERLQERLSKTKTASE